MIFELYGFMIYQICLKLVLGLLIQHLSGMMYNLYIEQVKQFIVTAWTYEILSEYICAFILGM